MLRRLGCVLLIFSWLLLPSCSLLVGNRAPVAVIEALPTRGEAPLAVEFDGSRSFDPDGLIVRYEWDFGDNTRAEGPQVSHTYARNGIYLVTLIVVDKFGESDQDRVRIVVGNPPPQAIFTASPISGWPPLAVTFDGSASLDPEGDELVSYEWDFGDGKRASGPRVTHTYPVAGRFIVELTVQDRDGASSVATLTVNVLDFLSLRPVRTGRSPVGGVLRDFDGDGHLDMAVVSSEANEVSLFFGRTEAGSFTFSAGEVLSVGRRPVALVAVDFNGDELMDLAVASLEIGWVSLIANEGHRRFRVIHELRVGRWTSAITSADFDGDGVMDLAVADAGEDRVTVLLGDEMGGFRLGKSVSVERWPAALAPGDYNRDGFLDLAVASFLADSVTVLLGDGLGGFREGGVRSVGKGPMALASMDLNADGRLDLMVANSLDANLSVLPGLDGGRFGLAWEVEVGEGVRALAVGDFDADGSPDVATANSGSNNVTVLLNEGSGQFRRPQQGRNFPAAGAPTAIATGDLDHDGLLDLVIVQFNADRISILLNQL